MTAVAEKSTHIGSSKQRIALFLAAELQQAIEKLAPCAAALWAPGDIHVLEKIQNVAKQA